MKIFLRNTFLLGGIYLIISFGYYITPLWQLVNFVLFWAIIILVLISTVYSLKKISFFIEKFSYISRYLIYIGWYTYTNIITDTIAAYKLETTQEMTNTLSNWEDAINLLSEFGIIFAVIAATVVSLYRLFQNRKLSKPVSKTDA